MTLKQETQMYYDRLRNQGVALIGFNCPHCHSALETEKNATSADWDSLSLCPECEQSFMKITQANNGAVATVCFQ